MKEIKLTQGQVALIDDEDYPLVSQYKWWAHKNCRTYYAVRSIRKNGKPSKQTMHIFLVGKGFDHIDHNGLNNQRNNLRPATVQQNNINQRSFRGSSKYKGVCWYRRLNKWRAYIHIDNKKRHLGYFEKEEDAAKAYNRAAYATYGEFAYLNPLGNQ